MYYDVLHDGLLGVIIRQTGFQNTRAITYLLSKCSVLRSKNLLANYLPHENVYCTIMTQSCCLLPSLLDCAINYFFLLPLFRIYVTSMSSSRVSISRCWWSAARSTYHSMVHLLTEARDVVLVTRTTADHPLISELF